MTLLVTIGPSGFDVDPTLGDCALDYALEGGKVGQPSAGD